MLSLHRTARLSVVIRTYFRRREELARLARIQPERALPYDSRRFATSVYADSTCQGRARALPAMRPGRVVSALPQDG